MIWFEDESLEASVEMAFTSIGPTCTSMVLATMGSFPLPLELPFTMLPMDDAARLACSCFREIVTNRKEEEGGEREKGWVRWVVWPRMAIQRWGDGGGFINVHKTNHSSLESALRMTIIFTEKITTRTVVEKDA